MGNKASVLVSANNSPSLADDQDLKSLFKLSTAAFIGEVSRKLG